MRWLWAMSTVLLVTMIAGPARATFGCFYKRVEPATFTRVDPRNPAYVRVTLGRDIGGLAPIVRDTIARAEAGDPDAQYAMAKRFAAGDGVPQNYELSLLLMREALVMISGDTRVEAECFAGGVQQLLAARAKPAVAVPTAAAPPTPVSGRR